MRLLLLLFYLHCKIALFCQQSVIVSPFLGYKGVYNSVEDKTQALPTFRTNTGNGSPDFGINIEYKKSHRWSFLIGVVHNAAGASFGRDYSFIDYQSNGRESGYTDLTQFNIGILHQPKKMIPLINFKRKNTTSYSQLIKQEKNKPPLSAKLLLAGGVGTAFFNETQNDLNVLPSAGSSGYTRDSMYFVVNGSNSRLKKNTTGFYTWLKGGLRFYRFGKEKIDISILLNIGLITLYTETDYDVITKRGEAPRFYQVTVGSKGTTLGFQVAFPITVWRKKS